MGLKKNRGFTLIEVLLASAILAVGIVFVLQAFSFCAKSAALSGDIIRAVFIAKDTLSELDWQVKGKTLPKATTETQGTLDKFSWSYTLTPLKDKLLSQCDFTIRWVRSLKSESINVSTYMR